MDSTTGKSPVTRKFLRYGHPEEEMPEVDESRGGEEKGQ